MIRDGSTCPLDEQECDSGQLVLNRAVMGQIEDLPVYCCHGLISVDGGRTYEQDPAGCKEVIRFGACERDCMEMVTLQSLTEIFRIGVIPKRCPFGMRFARTGEGQSVPERTVAWESASGP